MADEETGLEEDLARTTVRSGSFQKELEAEALALGDYAFTTWGTPSHAKQRNEMERMEELYIPGGEMYIWPIMM